MLKVNLFFIFIMTLCPWGSKLVNERLNLVENVEKIIFVSEWVRERFF